MTGVWRLIVANPLLVAQAMASASGAYVMVAAAMGFGPDNFVLFSLLVLLVQVANGCVGAFLFQSALVHWRHSPSANVKSCFVAAGAVSAAVVFGVTAWSLDLFSGMTIATLSVASTAPIFSEWMRYRAMSMDRRHDLLRADSARLLLTLLTPLVLWQTGQVAPYLLAVLLAWLAPFFVLVRTLPRVDTYTPRREYLRKSMNMLIDFAVGQLMAAVPLLILGSLGSSEYLGGVRLAQTILGPLNLAFTAFALNLATDSATRDSHVAATALIAHGRRLATRLGGLAGVLIPTAVLVVWLTGIGFRGVSATSLTIGLILVGLLAGLSGVSSIDAIVLHLLGRNGVVAGGRVILVALASAGFGVGFELGGVDGSLVIGLIVAAVANPIVFVLPANVVYRKLQIATEKQHLDEDGV